MRPTKVFTFKATWFFWQGRNKTLELLISFELRSNLTKLNKDTAFLRITVKKNYKKHNKITSGIKVFCLCSYRIQYVDGKGNHEVTLYWIPIKKITLIKHNKTSLDKLR